MKTTRTYFLALLGAAPCFAGVTSFAQTWDAGTIMVISVLAIPVAAFVVYALYLLMTGKQRAVLEQNSDDTT